MVTLPGGLLPRPRGIVLCGGGKLRATLIDAPARRSPGDLRSRATLLPDPEAVGRRVFTRPTVNERDRPSAAGLARRLVRWR